MSSASEDNDNLSCHINLINQHQEKGKNMLSQTKILPSEQEIFANLANICCQPGYIHAIAYFCARDNFDYEENINKNDSALIPTEIDLLIGLTIKADIDWSLPCEKTFLGYINETEKILKKLHDRLNNPSRNALENAIQNGSDFKEGTEWCREAIFYASQSAYYFQYFDLALKKYEADSEWLQKNCGFKIDDAINIAKSINEIIDQNISDYINSTSSESTSLDFFTFSTDEIASKANFTKDFVYSVLKKFELQLKNRNQNFNSLDDFNEIKSSPLISMPNGKFLLLQPYSLAEAIYESPSYWMSKDEQYYPTFTKNRGQFAEKFVADRLVSVFGEDNVYLNVKILSSKKAVGVSEIDVLVLWGNRAIIVQTKSKRLTIEARKGNDKSIRDDFKKAIQDAYGQGVKCAKALKELIKIKNNPDVRLEMDNKRQVILPAQIKKTYIFCVVSDYYPSLAHQSYSFLKTNSINQVSNPLVMDVFTIDVMTEMLQSPLQFFYYLNQRTEGAWPSSLSNHELDILSFHLANKNGLPVLPVNRKLYLGNFSTKLDHTMMKRRVGLQVKSSIDGILTRFNDMNNISRIIESDPKALELGLLLLSISDDKIYPVNKKIEELILKNREDKALYYLTDNKDKYILLRFICTDKPLNMVIPNLISECNYLKDKHKASQCFGIYISPDGSNLKCLVTLDFPWNQCQTT